VCGMSIGFAEDACASAGSLMPKAPVNEFAKFVGFEGESGLQPGGSRENDDGTS